MPDPLNSSELRRAENFLCRLAQAEMFAEEISNLTSGERVAKNSPLKWLNPFIDRDNILRVGGRLSNAPLTTLLAQVEMCLNSRPLTPMPQDPSDLEVLTPGHFLIGENTQSVPEVDLMRTADNRLDHWELTQKRFQVIWSRWYPEYLQQLQSRATKGCNPPVSIEEGRIVIIKEDNVPSAKWPLGKITKLHPGKDGVVRVVTLRTASAKEVVRAVSKIALLPVLSQSSIIE
ncbi:uncharacterized protein LOC129761502 [Toxorhynchites rutilus septentrionalis]|uniref:uncharacterized protein LOC129761502 n=1 Tax=Toxorhynchites rutilus septentrionalis TaxID=329112 RepID=UPI00247A3569|nr:uncharacterized protein LOC129761502 [Toxorhynchites rutilus septentrionalis]